VFNCQTFGGEGSSCLSIFYFQFYSLGSESIILLFLFLKIDKVCFITQNTVCPHECSTLAWKLSVFFCCLMIGYAVQFTCIFITFLSASSGNYQYWGVGSSSYIIDSSISLISHISFIVLYLIFCCVHVH
jgi:hypothetical protein